MKLAWLAAICLALGFGCEQQRLLGRSCPDGVCGPREQPLPPPRDCGVQLRSTPVIVAPGAALERCELFTLDALPPVGGGGHVYLTGAEAMRTSFSQNLDVRMAAEVADFEDGPVDCRELFGRAVSWIPLMTTQSGGEAWDFADAPLVAAPHYRVLVNQFALNTTEQPVEVSAALNVKCAERLPGTVSQAFEFSTRRNLTVRPGNPELDITGSCNFHKDVLVTRLYRRTHLITDFSVHVQRGSDASELLWDSGPDWAIDLLPPLEVAAGEGFLWQCKYQNTADLAFEVDGDSPDACALLGFYRLPDGGEDEAPEHCTR